jgi:hypothetical protein
MRCLWTILSTLVSLASAQAFTCDDVRALSQEQRAYYIKIYNITPAQQNLIRRVCSGSRLCENADAFFQSRIFASGFEIDNPEMLSAFVVAA